MIKIGIQAGPAAAKATPQQLLQAAEKLSRQRLDLERQQAAASQKLERITQELQETRAKEQEARAASLRALVPSVALTGVALAGPPLSAIEWLQNPQPPIMAGALCVKGSKTCRKRPPVGE